MNKKKVCSSCGIASFCNEEICPNCGERFSGLDLVSEGTLAIQHKKEKDTLLIICEKCGFKNEPAFNFCGKCGTPIKQIKKNRQQTLKEKNIAKAPLTTKLAYAIIIFFVILSTIIIFINSKDKSLSGTAVAMDKRGQVEQPVQVPQSTQVRISDLNKEIEKNPNDKNSLLELANLYHDVNYLPQAISCYKKYLSIDEKDTDARIDMAICYYSNGESETAIAEINKALKYSPRHQKAFFNLGIIFLNSGKFKESMENFQLCNEINPGTETGIRAKELIIQHKTAVK